MPSVESWASKNSRLRRWDICSMVWVETEVIWHFYGMYWGCEVPCGWDGVLERGLEPIPPWNGTRMVLILRDKAAEMCGWNSFTEHKFQWKPHFPWKMLLRWVSAKTCAAALRRWDAVIQPIGKINIMKNTTIGDVVQQLSYNKESIFKILKKKTKRIPWESSKFKESSQKIKIWRSI